MGDLWQLNREGEAWVLLDEYEYSSIRPNLDLHSTSIHTRVFVSTRECEYSTSTSTCHSNKWEPLTSANYSRVSNTCQLCHCKVVHILYKIKIHSYLSRYRHQSHSIFVSCTDFFLFMTPTFHQRALKFFLRNKLRITAPFANQNHSASWRFRQLIPQFWNRTTREWEKAFRVDWSSYENLLVDNLDKIFIYLERTNNRGPFATMQRCRCCQ